jgi:hypothetical protein
MTLIMQAASSVTNSGAGGHFQRLHWYHAVANECLANQGEKSFSTLAFVMALSAQSMGSLLALDEFDVFMDEKNRNLCFSVLCAEVSRSTRSGGKCDFLCPATMWEAKFFCAGCPATSAKLNFAPLQLHMKSSTETQTLKSEP